MNSMSNSLEEIEKNDLKNELEDFSSIIEPFIDFKFSQEHIEDSKIKSSKPKLKELNIVEDFSNPIKKSEIELLKSRVRLKELEEHIIKDFRKNKNIELLSLQKASTFFSHPNKLNALIRLSIIKIYRIIVPELNKIFLFVDKKELEEYNKNTTIPLQEYPEDFHQKNIEDSFDLLKKYPEDFC